MAWLDRRERAALAGAEPAAVDGSGSVGLPDMLVKLCNLLRSGW